MFFLFPLKTEGLSCTGHSGSVWGWKGAEAQPSWLAQRPGSRAQPGFFSPFVSGLSPAGKWLSVLGRPHEPGDTSQASEGVQGRSGSLPTVPLTTPSHRRCAVKLFFFPVHKLFKASKYKPIQREENRIKTQGSLHNFTLNSSLFG